MKPSQYGGISFSNRETNALVDIATTVNPPLAFDLEQARTATGELDLYTGETNRVLETLDLALLDSDAFPAKVQRQIASLATSARAVIGQDYNG